MDMLKLAPLAIFGLIGLALVSMALIPTNGALADPIKSIVHKPVPTGEPTSEPDLPTD